MVKVLIGEDNIIIAKFLQEALIDAGFGVCGIASTVAEGLELGERYQPELGVLDLFLLNGECGTEIATALRRRSRFGVLYSTGNPNHPLLSQAEGEGCITKPYLARSVVSALRIVGERLLGRPTSIPPPGFRLLASSSLMAHRPSGYHGGLRETAQSEQNQRTDTQSRIRPTYTEGTVARVQLKPLGGLPKTSLASSIR